MAEKYLSEKIIPALKAKTETKFAEEYGDSSTTALSQKFLSEKLNGNNVAIGVNSKVGFTGSNTAVGHNAQATGATAIAIGQNATAVNSSTIAIGGNASGIQSLAIGGSASNSYSIALGALSITNRSYEVSLGNTNGGNTTRYLANVKAGELDTDAVNVKQLNDTIGDINTLLETLVSGTGVK